MATSQNSAGNEESSSIPQDVDATAEFDEKLNAALQLLPSCQRCKRLRRKCDTNLPSCRTCQKADLECSFYDHSLQQVLPRSYVLSLLTRAQELRGTRKTGVASTTGNPAPQITPARLHANQDLLNFASAPIIPQAETYDEHFMLCTTTESTSRFFGCSSVVVLTVGLASRTFDDPSIFQSQNGLLKTYTANSEVGINNPIEVAKTRTVTPSKDMILTLIGHYMSSLNRLYPFIDASTLDADLEVYLSNTHDTQPPPPGTSKPPVKKVYQHFRIAMICAIACANKSRYMTHLSASDTEFYESGLPHVQAVTSSVSGESLQALLLLVLYCLFHPRKGDIWKLLDYACRLSVELGYHAEPQDSTGNDMSVSLSLRKNTFWSLYTIEQIVAQIFGRPCDLPGYIISTDYPGTLISGLSPGAEQGLTAHRYRIFYLRGEIYGELFLPTDSAVHSLEWFVQRFVTLSQWFEEIQVDGAEADIETATCDVAFHSTVIILFQPLLIRALSDTKEAELDLSARRLIPSENYRSACRLIRTYWNIVRAPHDSALGLYGMTIMSAHYIYLAGLTIMAHAQLSIDGRVKSLAPLDAGTLNEVAQQIDYSEIFEISGSCLVLLHWCASRWRGMVGMMDMYKRLSEKLLPLLARSGMA